MAEDKCWGFIEDDYCRFLARRGFHKTDLAAVPQYHENFGALVSPHPWDCSVDHFVGSEAARWIEQHSGDRPFAMMVGFPGPHHPYDPSADFATFRKEDMPEPIQAIDEDLAALAAPAGRPSPSGAEFWYAIRNEGRPGRDDFLFWRACYAGLVAQIDREVGAIVAALRQQGQLENTAIIFSSDHGDYLGDHGLTGKGSFYEGSGRVPLVVRLPGCEAAVREELVTLTDVTATLLGLAGCEVPSYMDSRHLPGLGITALSEPRQHLTSVLRSGWALYDGEWKLCRYRAGSHLFNLKEDPEELDNRSRDATCAAHYQRLDEALTAEIMRLMGEAFFPQAVAHGGSGAHSSSRDFGRKDWRRTYPVPWNLYAGED